MRNIAIAPRAEWTTNAPPPSSPAPKPTRGPRRWRDWLATLPIVLLIPALTVPLVVAMAGGPYLRLSTRDLTAGGHLQVAGGGLAPGSRATLAWDEPKHALAKITADEKGKFLFERVNVPTDAKDGRHYVMIADPSGKILVKARVEVDGSAAVIAPIVKLNPRPTPATGTSTEATPSPDPTTAPTASPEPTAEPTSAATATPTTAPTATPKPTSAPTATPTSAPTATPKPTATPTTPPPASELSSLADALYPSNLKSLPTSGSAWSAMKSRADGSLGSPNISDQDDATDINVLAAAFVYARTGTESYRTRAAAAIRAAVGTEAGGRTLALGRNLPGYVIAAAAIDLPSLDPSFDKNTFRPWLRKLLTENLDGRTLRSTHEDRPNNWGTHAGAARAAIALYLGDSSELAATANVFRGWLGDRSAYAGFSFGDLSWQCDPAKPVAVAPAGCVKGGVKIDGALPEEMRRGGAFTWPPAETGYAWEGLQGAVLQADLLYRAGYATWAWSDRALYRAAKFLYDVADWPATSDDEWQPWLIDARYGTDWHGSAPAQPGKNFGFTDWLYGS